MGSKLALQIVIGHVQSLRRSCEVCCWAEQQKKDIEIKGKIKETFTSLLTLSTGAYSAGGREREGVCLSHCQFVASNCRCCFSCFNLLLTCGLKTIEVWLSLNYSCLWGEKEEEGRRGERLKLAD